MAEKSSWQTRDAMRCFKDIATAGTGAVDAETVQLIYAFLRSKNLLEQKMVLDLRSVLANIRPAVMETVSVLPFGNFGEDRKREMRKT